MNLHMDTPPHTHTHTISEVEAYQNTRYLVFYIASITVKMKKNGEKVKLFERHY